MQCDDAIKLVEKLADGEASEREKAAAGVHLESCVDCRRHLAFLTRASELARSEPFPEPPEAYWDSLPRKIMGRIAIERESLSFWHRLFSPGPMRWLAATAVLGLVVLAGVRVFDEASSPVSGPPGSEGFESEPRLATAEDLAEATEETPSGTIQAVPDPKQEQPAPTANLRQDSDAMSAPAQDSLGRARSGAPAEPSAPSPVPATTAKSPVTARDESPPAEPARAMGPQPTPRREVGASSAAGPRPAPIDSSDPSRKDAPGESSPAADAGLAELSMASASRLAGTSPAVEAESETLDNPALRYRRLLDDDESTTDGRRSNRESDCDGWRGFLRDYPESDEALDARYRLARCSLGRFTSIGGEETRAEAIRDGELFIVGEGEGPRAEEIRQALERIRREDDER